MSGYLCEVCAARTSSGTRAYVRCVECRIAGIDADHKVALAASAARVKALEGERDAALGVGDGFRNETYELRARAEAAEARVRVLEAAAAHAHKAPTALQAVECPVHHKSWLHCAHGHSEYVCDLCNLACRDWVAANRAHEAAKLGGTTT